MNQLKQEDLARKGRILEHRRTLARMERYTVWAFIGITVAATLYFIL